MINKEELKSKLIQANNELQQIYVRGIDTKHMYIALGLLEQSIIELDQKPEEKVETK